MVEQFPEAYMSPLPEDFLRQIGQEESLTKGQMAVFIARLSGDEESDTLPNEAEVVKQLGIKTGALRAHFTEIYKKLGKRFRKLDSAFHIPLEGPGKFRQLYLGLRKLLDDQTRNVEPPAPLALQMPPLPRHFVPRSHAQQAVKDLLFCPDPEIPGTLIVTAIAGAAGIGKSILAASLGHDPEVQARFPDGILWATLGAELDMLPALEGWMRSLQDPDFQPTTVENATAHLRTLLSAKQVLLIVDDVRNPIHFEPFRVGKGASRLLVTTRSAPITDAQRYDLEAMTPQDALALLTKLLGKRLIPDASQALTFAQQVKYVPLALEQGAAQVKEGMTWTELLEEPA